MRSGLAAAARGLGAVHDILLAFPVALFCGALATDVTYLRTAEVQWTNFSSWLIAGALLFGGLVLAWALIAWLIGLRGANRGRRLLYVVVLAVMWGLGFINALKHSQDAWSSVGTFGLILSIACAALALLAGFIAYSDADPQEIAR